MTIESNAAPSWWGSFNVNTEQSMQWRIGPLSLIVRRLSGEWQFAYERNDDFEENTTRWDINSTDQFPEHLNDSSRYVLNDSSGCLNITPLLADRPIISRPLTPFNLTAGEEVNLYVSSPLWINLAVGSDRKKALTEIAIQRPSDTWFGPSTREGELCYASTTHCRLNVDELRQLPHRAITPVIIRNKADTTLAVERLNVPAPLLALYASATGKLWTPKITLIRNKDGDMAELKISNEPPEEIEQPTLVSDARNKTSNGVLFRAFNTVFR